MVDQAQLTQIFCSRPQNYAWFIGAGASRSSGLPTATDIIWDLKRRYYCREENQELSRQDIQNRAVRDRIQSFMDSRGFPAIWEDNEYTTYFEKIFGDDYERQRKYLRATLSDDKASLSVGNRVLGALLAEQHCRVVFTTNFDTLVEKAVAEIGGQSLSPFHLEGSYAAVNALNNEEFPLYVKLHGDFRYTSLKNLSVDLSQQNSQLAGSFIGAGSRFGFVVAGYSGRDESVMQLFEQVLTLPNPFPHGLYWTGMKGVAVHQSVKDFLERATKAGVNAHYVEIETFDALMLRLWRNLDSKSPEHDAKVRKARGSTVNIPLPPHGNGKPLLRLNALPLLAMPDQCLELTFKKTPEFQELREKSSKAKPSVLLAKVNGILCWGSQQRVREIFGSELSGVAARSIGSNFDGENLQLKGFFEEALGRAMANERPLVSLVRYSTTYLIVETSSTEQPTLAPLTSVVGKSSGVIKGLFTEVTSFNPKSEQVRWSEALRISIEQKEGRTWVLITPDVWIWPPRARKSATEFLSLRKKERLNQKHNELLDAWIRILFGTEEKNTEITIRAFLGDSSGAENPSFQIGNRTAYMRRLSS